MVDYKKIIKSRSVRVALVRMLSFIPDKMMISLQYYIKTGHKLDLKNPKRYTEKLQWLKLNYKNPLMIRCVDKYDVRKHVENLGLGSILTKCYGVFDSVEDIDFSILPDKFVLKDTLGSGGNSVIICTDKNTVDIDSIKKHISAWVKINHKKKSGGREWPYYSGKKHRIIIEEYIDSDISEGGLIDYKFLCFNGKPVILYILADREMGEGAGCGIFNMNFEKLPYLELDERPLKRDIKKPDNLSDMIAIAKKLSKDFPEVRVDLFNRDGRIIFGELTFFDSSGYMLFEPDDFDVILGKKLTLPKKR